LASQDILRKTKIKGVVSNNFGFPRATCFFLEVFLNTGAPIFLLSNSISGNLSLRSIMTGTENIFNWTGSSALLDPYIRHLTSINNKFTVHLAENLI